MTEAAALASDIRAAQEGSRESLRHLISQVAPTVRRTCRMVLGAQHPDLEDTIQETMLATVQALSTYRFEAELRSYVTTIALRMAIAARRRSVARWRMHEPLDGHALPSSVPWHSSDSFIEGVQLVDRMLDDVTGVQRQALLLRVILGCSIDEIARLTGVSPNTVKTRLRRGKNGLRRGCDESRFLTRLFATREPAELRGEVGHVA